MKGLYINFSATERFCESSYDLKRIVREAVKGTLRAESFPYDAEVSVTFCDNEYIRGLNAEFRNIDRATDVLSFPLYEDGDFDPVECEGGAVLGDIVISLERAKEQAEEIGNSFYREVAFLAVHSTLHLLGYDHERSREDEEKQCARQRKIMESINI